MLNHLTGVVITFLATASFLDSVVAQSTTPQVAATVNGQAITWSEIRKPVLNALGDFDVSEQRQKQLEKVALNQAIDQLVVMHFLESRDAGADPSEVRIRLEQIQSNLKVIDQTLAQKLKETGQTQDQLTRQLRWQIAWKKYLDGKLTDEFLESHYTKNARKFDGTELKVAHLLLKEDSAAPAEANQIREDVVNGKLLWNEATQQHSIAPTRTKGGEIGWIGINGPMPKPFTRAAFELDAGQVSAPVKTRFGVHLIRCLEVRNGKLGFRDAIESVKKDAERALFAAIKKQHASNVKIEIAK